MTYRSPNVSRESPPLNFEMTLSSDNETVAAVTDVNPDIQMEQGAVGDTVNPNLSPSMRPFWESLSTQRELRRLGSYNAPGQAESRNTLTPSRLRTRLRAGAIPRQNDNQTNH